MAPTIGSDGLALGVRQADSALRSSSSGGNFLPCASTRSARKSGHVAESKIDAELVRNATGSAFDDWVWITPRHILLSATCPLSTYSSTSI
jgi:hypothetical protein